MPVKDLREWIERIDAIGELTRVDGADTSTDIGGLTDMFQWDMGNPALLFDRIAGFPSGFRVLSNVLTSLKRVALSLDLPIDSTPTELVLAWRDKLEHMQPRPVQDVGSGPVLSNQLHDADVDVTRFPAPVWHAKDGGAYIGTGDIVIMRDPDTGWINAGTYRVQVHDERTLGLYISSGKHGRLIRDKYWQRGQACPVAVSVGHDPLLLLLGGLEVDYGTNEYDVAGGVRNAALEVVSGPRTGLPIPASAEIVFEGEIPPDELHEEGPFGEWAGYYASGRKPEPIINVQSVLYRDDPIVLGCIPGKPPNDNTFFRSPLRSALIWNELERAGVPGIVGVWSHEAGGGRLMNIVSIRQMYPGHAKQVGAAMASCHAGAYANRWVIVVDDDIDPTDTNEVLWALCTRTDVVDDVDVLRRCWSTGLDPMAYGGQSGVFFNNRMIIDACRPFERLKTFPTLARADAQEAATLRTRWSELFGADGKARRDARQVSARDNGQVSEPTHVRH
ncbi:MAG TPA: UbiD family decarboxylase [Chloroflexota bacterium]|jgi:4-hydroxy-3-polyprenylbenzoate decarboxylase